MRMTATDSAVAELIREVLAEELARLRTGTREERVRIVNDADLAAFAKRMLALADDREAREALEKGALVFRLDAGAGAAGGVGRADSAADGARSGETRGHRTRGGADASGPASPSSPAATGSPEATGHTEVIEQGLLTERRVDRLPRGTARVRLGSNVRMTPLARDSLRRRRIAIEREQ